MNRREQVSVLDISRLTAIGEPNASGPPGRGDETLAALSPDPILNSNVMTPVRDNSSAGVVDVAAVILTARSKEATDRSLGTERTIQNNEQTF